MWFDYLDLDIIAYWGSSKYDVITFRDIFNPINPKVYLVQTSAMKAP